MAVRSNDHALTLWCSSIRCGGLTGAEPPALTRGGNCAQGSGYGSAGTKITKTVQIRRLMEKAAAI